MTNTQNFPVNDRQTFEDGFVTDREIEENFKSILSDFNNGKLLTANIVSHLKYFHNTLSMDHKNHPNHDDPFKNIDHYPALSYVTPEHE